MSHIWSDELLWHSGPSALVRHWHCGCQPPTSATTLCCSVLFRVHSLGLRGPNKNNSRQSPAMKFTLLFQLTQFGHRDLIEYIIHYNGKHYKLQILNWKQTTARAEDKTTQCILIGSSSKRLYHAAAKINRFIENPELAFLFLFLAEYGFNKNVLSNS